MVAGSFPVEYENATVIKYADDFTVCAALLKNSSNNHLYELHESFLKWSTENCLIINHTKSKTLCVHARRNVAPVHLPNVSIVQQLKILGVYFDASLSWTPHCNYVVKKASQRLYVLRILKSFVSRDTLISVYNALVRSCIEYASPLLIGLSAENSRKLERVQKRFHRLLCGNECREECLQPLSVRRLLAAQKLFLQSMDSTSVLHHLVPTQSRTGRFVLPATSMSLRLKSFFPATLLYLNSIHTR